MNNKECEILQYEKKGASIKEYSCIVLLFIVSLVVLAYMLLTTK